MTRIEVKKDHIVGENKWNTSMLYADVDIAVELDVSYIADEDVTIVWQFMYVGGRPVQRTLVGWYHGEPNDETTKHYATNHMSAYYLD